MSCRLNLIFNDRIVKHWEIDIDKLLQRRRTTIEWFEHLAASVHYLAIHNWLLSDVLCPKTFASFPSGVEVWFRLQKGQETCGVTVSKRGTMLIWPVHEDLKTEAAMFLLEHMRKDKKVSLIMRIRESSSDTWGGALHKAIVENVRWQEEIMSKIHLRLSEEVLDRWAVERRRADSADAYAMSLVLVQDANAFLRHFFERTKQGMLTWRKFVATVWGEEEHQLLVLACPRMVVVQEDVVSSNGLALLSRRDKFPILSQVQTLLQNLLRKMEKPRLTPSVLFSTLNVTPLCSPETAVTLVAEDKDCLVTNFYLEAEAKESVEEYAKKMGYALVKTGTVFRACIVEGVVTKMEKWTLDDRIHLVFLLDAQDKVFESFSEEVKHKNVTFRCQKSSRVFTEAVAVLIRALQRGDEDTANRLRTGIKIFFERKKMPFPIIDGQKRRKKKIYFSDYNKPFSFGKDGGDIVPEHCAPIAYTKEMHAKNASLEIW